jgi:hypothetical protein
VGDAEECDAGGQRPHQPPPFSVAMAGRGDQTPGVPPPAPLPLSPCEGGIELQHAARPPHAAVSRRARIRSPFEEAGHQVVSSGLSAEPDRGVLGARRASGISLASCTSRISADGQAETVAGACISPRRSTGNCLAEGAERGGTGLRRSSSGMPDSVLLSHSSFGSLGSTGNGGGGGTLLDGALQLVEFHQLQVMHEIGRGSFGVVSFVSPRTL